MVEYLARPGLGTCPGQGGYLEEVNGLVSSERQHRLKRPVAGRRLDDDKLPGE